MSVRITSQTMSARVMADLRASQAKVTQYQREVSTGKKISQASDDPLGTSDALKARGDLAGLAKTRDSVAGATAWVSATDSAMSSITDVLHRVHELTVQGATATTTNAARAAIAKEVGQLIETVKDAANAKVGDAYVFGGTGTTAPPYAAGAVDAYAGDNGTIARSIGPGVSVQVNTTGAQLLGSGGGDGKLLDTLRTIQANLVANNTNALGTTDLAALDAGAGTVSDLQATVGATQNRLDAADARLTDAQLATNKVLDNAEGADIAESLINLNAQSAAYSAAIKTASNILQPSLLDFLR